ncbi:hypothetical protein GCM10022294_27490 [Dietzia aurantiaca]
MSPAAVKNHAPMKQSILVRFDEPRSQIATAAPTANNVDPTMKDQDCLVSVGTRIGSARPVAETARERVMEMSTIQRVRRVQGVGDGRPPGPETSGPGGSSAEGASVAPKPGATGSAPAHVSA